MKKNQGFVLTKLVPLILLIGAVVVTAVLLGQRTGFFNRAAPLTSPQTGPNPTYNKCVNNACTPVIGVGISDCQLNVPCGATPSATPKPTATLSATPTKTPSPSPKPSATPTSSPSASITPPPTGDLFSVSIVATPNKGKGPLKVKLSALSPYVPIVDYQWNFNDNSGGSTSKKPTHIFAYRKEPYKVVLKATGPDGKVKRVTTTITVTKK